jgi:hypothetical protein
MSDTPRRAAKAAPTDDKWMRAALCAVQALPNGRGNAALTSSLTAAATLSMHAALLRVADLWGPCPAGPDDAPIFCAGPAFGTLGDLRAVEAALALVEGRAHG